MYKTDSYSFGADPDEEWGDMETDECDPLLANRFQLDTPLHDLGEALIYSAIDANTDSAVWIVLAKHTQFGLRTDLLQEAELWIPQHIRKVKGIHSGFCANGRRWQAYEEVRQEAPKAASPEVTRPIPKPHKNEWKTIVLTGFLACGLLTAIVSIRPGDSTEAPKNRPPTSITPALLRMAPTPDLASPTPEAAPAISRQKSSATAGLKKERASQPKQINPKNLKEPVYARPQRRTPASVSETEQPIETQPEAAATPASETLPASEKEITPSADGYMPLPDFLADTNLDENP
jgi:hypothetical protein